MRTTINISFDQAPPYKAGEELSGRVTFETFEAVPVKKVELSVLWYTIGKGTEDSAVIYFDTPLQDDMLTMSSAIPFSFSLPALPLSYAGQLIKIHWAVRVRVFPRRGRKFGEEARFQVVAAETTG